MAQGELERVSQITVQTLKFHRQTTDAQVCRVSELMKPVMALYGTRLMAAGIALHENYEREADLRCRMANYGRCLRTWWAMRRMR